MQRTRRATKRTSIVESSSDSENDIPLKKLQKSSIKNGVPPVHEKKINGNNASSSSESDIENYLQPIDKIDLNSSFFNIQKKHKEEFQKIEKDIFAGVRRLSDSDSDEDMKKEEVSLESVVDESRQEFKHQDLENKPSTSTGATKLNFQQLEEYTRKIEEAKRHVEEYNARKKAEEHHLDISNLLAAGESKQITLEDIKPEDLHSSDFESCDSEQEDWEEVKIKDSQEAKEKSLVPKDGLQITVDMPDTCRKKKGVDLLAAMKRRLNRIRKENQVYVHKVHLLCWLAHGNYVNECINDTQTLGLALSLLPSDKCYPADRTDLTYLEQIVQWYKKTIDVTEKPVPKNMELVKMLEKQINKKAAFNKKMLVYIFVAVLRSLGIQCRLVLSLQVEPLRPPASELHSLAKDDGKAKTAKVEDKNKKITKTKAENVAEEKKTNSKQAKKGNQKKEGVAKPKKEDLEKGKPPDKKSKEMKVESSSKTTETKQKDGELKKSKPPEKKSKEVSSSKTTEAREKDSKEKKEPSKFKEAEKELKGKKSKKSSEESSVKKEKTKSTKEREYKKSKENVYLSINTLEKDKNVRSKSAEHKKSLEKNTAQLTVKETKIRRSKSEDIVEQRQTRAKPVNAVKKEIIKIKYPKKEKSKVSQLDGANNSSDEDNDSIFDDDVFTLPQLDGADDKNKKNYKTKKPNLKKLNTPIENSCKVKTHPSRLKSNTADYDSENDFRPRSHFNKNAASSKSLPNRKVNLQKLKNPSDTQVKVRPVSSPSKKELDVAKKSPEKLRRVTSPPKKQMDVKNDIINLIKGRITEQKHIDRSRKVKRKPTYASDSDSDYMPEPIKKKHHDSDSDIDYFVPKPKVKQRVSFRNVKLNQSSTSNDDSEKKKKKATNVWVEVFLEAEEKWISVDVARGQVHCVNELYTRATHPVCYVVAWNNDSSIKDITMRYCKNFNTITRKLRVDAKWWEETLKPFLGKRTARDKEEDDDLNRQQLDQPLPTSIAEYKNHPLYALRRHLLKFEAIYPPDIPPLGFVRSEPVYPRNCVYVCRSRDIWVKEARVVKPGEKPYKIVKARPKYDKLSNTIITDQLLEIFGEWQTMDYEPPTAENGIVPRNAFGNVELFKPCMLPKKTVHLKLVGLNKVCKKLNIDCASAIVGFDFHCGWSHPIYDGFVVCEEFADTVVAAWELDQEEMERKENEKIEKRVYGNWKKLIRGLLIRERLKAKYDFGSTSAEGGKEKKKSKGPRFCTKKRRICSDSESDSDDT